MTTPVEVHTMKANDLRPVVVDVLGYDPLPVGASAAAVARRDQALAELTTWLADPTTVVRFIMSPASSTWEPTGGPVKVNKVAEVVDAATRTIRYTWATGDTNVPGQWLYEWQLVRGNVPQTFPGNRYNRVAITADLDGAAS